jgi:hypothetical protein
MTMPTRGTWVRRAVLLLALCGVAAPALARNDAPVMPGPEAKRAFDELTALYQGKGKPPYEAALKELGSADAGRRERAGRYLHALLAQAYADDIGGRGPCRRTPFWGGGAVCDAREIRKEVALAFGRGARGAAALDAALWLVREEKVADNQAAGMQVIARVESPRVEAIVRALVAPPHPSADVLRQAVELAGKRRLARLGPELGALCGSPRTAVREAVTKAAPAVGLKLPGPCAAPTLLPPEWERQVAAIGEMVVTPVPPAARWMRFTHTDPRSRVGGKPVVEEIRGWLLAEEAGAWRVLDVFASERNLPKVETKARSTTLGDDAREILALRKKGGRGVIEGLSARGGLTGQFQAQFISLPEALLAAWALARGDRALAAALVVPRIDETRDDRWIGWVVRDLLGHHYHQEMLLAFSHERDYGRALRLARHLSGPRFAEYDYQERARELAAQLARRSDDFVTFTLPTPAAWAKLKTTMSRAQQIAYLGARLRLLNCIQWGQPGGVSYADQQHAGSRLPPGGPGQGRVLVVNPYHELLAMRLTLVEVPVLVPRLGDQDFMPTFSYWRDFHPARTLHRVSWAAAEIINAAAKRDLAQLPAFEAADAAGRARHLESIVAWCRANSGKSPADLVRQTIATTKDLGQLQGAGREAIRLKDERALPVLIGRLKDFPRQREDVVRLVYGFNDPAALRDAREWAKDADEGVRFWAALVLVRHGRRTDLEGLRELRPILERDDGSRRCVEAFDALMDTGMLPAVDLAAGILAKPRFEIRGSGAAVHRLFLKGRREALDYVLEGLEKRGDGGVSSGQYRGKPVERKQVEGDAYADMVVRWQLGNKSYDVLAPDAVRAAERRRLAAWLRQQFALIQAGKPPAMRTRAEPLVRGEWQVDAP